MTLVLIVFRPQCQEPGQEYVGVLWSARGAFKAIKKGFLLAESIKRYSMTQGANTQSCWSGFLSHLVLIWLLPPSPSGERRGSTCFSFHFRQSSIITFHAQQSFQKIGFIKVWADVKKKNQVWMNFVYFPTFMRYVLNACGEMRYMFNGGDRVALSLLLCFEDFNLWWVSLSSGMTAEKGCIIFSWHDHVSCRATAPLWPNHALSLPWITVEQPISILHI